MQSEYFVYTVMFTYKILQYIYIWFAAKANIVGCVHVSLCSAKFLAPQWNEPYFMYLDLGTSIMF